MSLGLGKDGSTTKTASFIIGGLFAIYFVILFVVYLSGIGSGGGMLEAYDKTNEGISNVFLPILNGLLGIKGVEANLAFLMIISFILIMIIVVNTLDAIKIFGDEATLLNFAVGLIVSVIGVRFMPSDLWYSLTAPSSAFVATVLVGVPFAALALVTFKLRSKLASKLLWVFYIVFMSALIIKYKGTFAVIYWVFIGLSVLMLILEGTIRRFVHKEEVKDVLRNTLDLANTEKEIELQERIIVLTKTRDKAKRGSPQRASIERELNNLKKDFKEVAGRDFKI